MEEVLHSTYQQIWKMQQWPQDWKRSVFIPIPKKGNAKECSNYCTIAVISNANKIMLRILQAKLQQYVNWEIPDVQTWFRKDRGNRDKIANIPWIIEMITEFQKTSTSASLTMLNPLTVWITTNCGKSLGILVNLTCLLRSLYGDKNLQLELDVEQRTKLDREYIVTRLYIVTLLI